MTYIEQLGLKELEDFVEKAEKMGLSYGGRCNETGFGFGKDMEESVESMVVHIVKDYIDEYKEERQ